MHVCCLKVNAKPATEAAFKTWNETQNQILATAMGCVGAAKGLSSAQG